MITRNMRPLLGAPAPDWTNADDYPDPSSASVEDWVEEFKRRNPGFKKALAELEAFVRANFAAFAPESVFGFAPEGLATGSPDSEPFYTPLSPLGQVYAEFNNRLAELFQFEPKRWTDDIRPGAISSEPTHSFAPTQSSVDVLVRLNPNYPSAPQLDRAKALLERKQQSLPRDGGIAPIEHRKLVSGADKYRLYLRLLDAEVAGARGPRMAEVLFPHMPNKPLEYRGSRAVRDSLKAARKLRDGGYRSLPLTEK
jgi:hypothetical protein